MLELFPKLIRLARHFSSRIRDQESVAPTVRTDKNKTPPSVFNLASMQKSNKLSG